MELLQTYSNMTIRLNAQLGALLSRASDSSTSEVGGPDRSPRQVQRRLGPAEVDRLVDGYRAGSTVRQLSAEFGVSRATVSAHLERQGLPRRYNRLSGDALAEAGRLYGDGWSLARLGERYGLDAGTVRRALLKSGVQTRPRQGR